LNNAKGKVVNFIPLLRPIFLVAIGLAILGPSNAGWAQETFTLHGRVTDREGKGVAGAEVALYTTPDVRRPVDFITPPTIANGSYAIALPPGEYWAVARKRQSGRFGPLQPTDQHSGAPAEIAGKSGEKVTADFTVASIREMGEERQPPEEETVRLRARVIDNEGAPVANAYLYARREEAKGGIPDFVSPAADHSGVSILLLPPGKYFIGADLAFPPREGADLQEVTVSPGKNEAVIDLEVPR
jgi:hypothetical protein